MTAAMRNRPLTATTAYATLRLLIAPTTDVTTDDIDWIAVERAAAGEYPRVDLTPDEQREAALILTRAGFGAQIISTRLSVYERLVMEWQAAAGLLPPERLCTVGQCRRARSGRGLCAAHLQALRAKEKKQRKEQEAAA